jgi:hypothetical protein
MKVVGKVSQCANCTAVFVVQDENNVLYCSEECEQRHDLFLFAKGEIENENHRIANQNAS